MEKPKPRGITARIRGFQDGWSAMETCVVHQESERRKAYCPLADLCVSVDPRSPRTQAVVEVEAADPPLTEPADRLLHHRLGAGLGGQVISRAEEMAGVQADADPSRCAHPRENFLQVLQPVSKTVALTGGDLQADPGSETRKTLVNLVQRLGHEPEPAPARGMRAGMEDQRTDAERLAPRELLSHGRQAPAADQRVLRGQVHEVASVGDRRDLRSPSGPPERPPLGRQ